MSNENETIEIDDSFSAIENSINIFASEKRSRKADTPPKHYVVFDESETITLDNTTVKRFHLRDNKISSKEAYETVTKILNTRNGKILAKILYILALDYKLRQIQLAKEKAELMKAVAKEKKTKEKPKEVAKETSDVIVTEVT
jgi:hypothetical protein